MFEPGHLNRKKQPGMPGVPDYDIDVYYEVRHDPKEGVLLHFRLSGQVAGQSVAEEFDMHRDTAFNFASRLAKAAVKLGLPPNASPIMRSHGEYDAMFADIRKKLNVNPGDPVDFDHLDKDGF
ncbi:DUF5064 family protein [Pseudomonas sp. AOB-7]|jgi:hypothetical protein|uniref:DUF5064 family protein n=1 Tax=Pseudomonas sp. AOB-7 TaxID=2482750 RepID=UPI000EFBFCFC|nr:DUF5064 family protein [Pseudomonas sp. AOB-7]RMH84339.1 DUF5064 family protein [Pseudomonas sp. AOB-7]